MLIDTHCHLDFPEFNADREDVIKRAKEHGISYIINVGSSLEGSIASLELAKKYDMIYASLGIHPHEADNTKKQDLEYLISLLDDKKVVSIGEIGLDYYRNISSKENQRSLFKEQLLISKDKDLPVIIHNRASDQDVMSILKDTLPQPIKGVMHCFSGDEALLMEVLDLGMYVSFTCNITFKNSQPLRDVLRLVPMERLLLETDSPFLAPQILRGKRNEPSFVEYAAGTVSDIKKIPIDEVKSLTTENALRFFNI